MIGRWNVEINFADGNKRSLRFDVQADGKGTFLLVDPMLSRWGPAKPSEAKWTPGNQNSVTFSGAVEFPLGNVGRDAGTLMFKGKFETPDSISGEVEFAPLVGDGRRNTARLKPLAIILPIKRAKHTKIFGRGIFCLFVCFVDTSSPELATKW